MDGSPTPKKKSVGSNRKRALFSDSNPPAPIYGTELAVKLENVGADVNVLEFAHFVPLYCKNWPLAGDEIRTSLIDESESITVCESAKTVEAKRLRAINSDVALRMPLMYGSARNSQITQNSKVALKSLH